MKEIIVNSLVKVEKPKHGADFARSIEEKEQVVNRLNRAYGHLDHVRKIMALDATTEDILIQLKAVEKELSATALLLTKQCNCHVFSEKPIDPKKVDEINRLMELL
jgi:DNA-binding FrmR family transcriptional regulator